ncbi:SdpI family protein [Lacticigenium naphthae]|uniref:SdpI family protein n=1 Tax=Lacticigenium naphthae TaxID=515351 RepID=UPI0003F698E1|nr:SdpI family protein [Lacticigenium naphthae]
MKSKPESIGIITLLAIVILALGFFVGQSQPILILMGILVLMILFLLDWYTPRIAKLSPDNPKVKTMRRLNRFFILLFAVLFSALIWFPGFEEMMESNDDVVAFVFTLAIMVIIGNVAPKIPFNRYMGLRLPWTIRDEATWNVAHRILGYSTFPIAFGMVFALLFGVPVEIVATGGILTWIAIPSVYSLWFYYQH